MTPNPAHGLLVLDKPSGITSRDAVNAVQQWFPRKTKIGHTGTLDPLASGVLVVCVGHATRLAEYVQAMGKTYKSTFVLGAVSDTDDADGAITQNPAAQPLDEPSVRCALAAFAGEVEQIPPAYSAAKVAGQRAHTLARGGEEVDLKPRRVAIYQIDGLAYKWPRLEVEVRCGKGTYIRAIARDLGQKLGCGAYVDTLRRTRVGPFTTEAAITLDMPPDVARQGLRPVSEAVAELSRVEVDADTADRLRLGQFPPAPPGTKSGDVAVFSASELIAVAFLDGKRLRPIKVIPAVSEQ
jgi:tRNA pseudouridine55 synthase